MTLDKSKFGLFGGKVSRLSQEEFDKIADQLAVEQAELKKKRIANHNDQALIAAFQGNYAKAHEHCGIAIDEDSNTPGVVLGSIRTMIRINASEKLHKQKMEAQKGEEKS